MTYRYAVVSKKTGRAMRVYSDNAPIPPKVRTEVRKYVLAPSQQKASEKKADHKAATRR